MALYQELLRRRVPTEYLDGDVIRHLLPGLGFSRDERDAHVNRVGDWASQLEAQGVDRDLRADLAVSTGARRSAAAVPALRRGVSLDPAS